MPRKLAAARARLAALRTEPGLAAAVDARLAAYDRRAEMFSAPGRPRAEAEGRVRGVLDTLETRLADSQVEAKCHKKYIK